jgi:hypothetical protein
LFIKDSNSEGFEIFEKEKSDKRSNKGNDEK